ncbi:GNAT family N-acetyltransferase [Streptosporangium sp. NPDC048865]|uniref:GNAT family N-acetyltransferase n=1 Tax=Streptosporangium sp. NPDC048865 TaxID=3155766 RepID=UPI003440FEF6
MPKPLSVRDLQPQLAANRRYWTGLAGAGGADDPGAGLPIYRTGVAHPLMNGVLRVRDVPLDDAVAEARRRLDGSVWAWWVGADSDEGTAERLVARGAEEIATLPVMALDLDRIATSEAPGDLGFRTITDATEMAEYVGTFAAPMGITTGLDLVMEREIGFGCPGVVRRAAVVDGRMVGTCTLSLATDVAALYCVTTSPDVRRQGIATALTLDALRIARNSGRRVATLQASGEGEPVYRRIGFETVSRYRLLTFGE